LYCMPGTGTGGITLDKNALVSVVVITYNEEKNIEDCIKSINASTYNDYEIIVSDGGSSDRTIELLKKFSNVKILACLKKGMTVQRNYGFSNAAGRYILSLDADMRITPELIKDCVEKINKGVVGLYVPEIVAGNSLFNKIRRFERSFYNGTVIDAVRFFEKQAAESIGFYDEKIREACEDWDFDKRMKKIGGVLVSSSCLYHNEKSLNLAKYLKKKVKYTQTMDDYIKKWGKDDPEVKKQFGAFYRMFIVFVENGKWKKAASHPLLFSGVAGLKLLVGATYIASRVNPK